MSGERRVVGDGSPTGGPLLIHFAGMAGDAPEWTVCDDCQTFWRENRDAVSFAAASAGIERGLTANQAVNVYFEERHAKHA